MAVMMITAAIGAGVAVAGAIGGYVSSRKAAKEQKKLDRENRALYKRELDESIRRTQETQRTTEATASTQVAASGFAVGSSLDRYVDTMQAQHSSDIDWMRTSGASILSIQEREASARYDLATAQSRSQLFSGLGSAVGQAGQTYTYGAKYGWK